MRDPCTETRTRLNLDQDRYQENERLVAYEVGNTLLMLNLELQQRFGLRAEEFQIFHLIVLSTIQKFVRTANAGDSLLDRTPLPREEAGSISRRRISETLGIPLETVRRTVAGLLERGMIIEPARGNLSTPGGTLASLAEDGFPERMTRRFLATGNALIRLGAVELEESR